MRFRGPSNSQKKMPCQVPERQPAVPERDEHLRAHQRRPNVGGGVLLARLDVLPPPVLADHALERGLEVARDGWIGVLVDGHARSRVWHEHERGGGAVRLAERGLDVARDLHELRLPLRLHRDLPQGNYPTTVPNPPATTQELDRIRDRADRFIAELDQEYYEHFAGLKESFELAPIYERYADLTTLDTANAIGAAVDGDPHVRELWRFGCENYLGALTREHSEKVAMLEATLEAEIDGDKVPFRMLRPTLGNEPDREKRRAIDRVRTTMTEEHLNPVYLDAVRVHRRGLEELGELSYTKLYNRFGYKLEELADQCREVLESTERIYEDSADKLFRDRVGVGLDEAERWDVLRVFRATEWDPQFPGERMLPALEATLADLGIDLRSQQNVHLDIEQRPNKTPRAFCAPIEVPDKVMLVIQPMGGADDWRALFHEAGHTEHYAHTSPDLSVEERRLGDNAVTEGWATLLQSLTDDPTWLARRLDFPRPQEFAVEGATGFLYFVRRYCAKLLYELEFFAAGDVAEDGIDRRYVEILGDALKIEPSAVDYLGDIDASFYVTAYLRSWAFEAQIRTHLRERFGRDWFAKREAGSLLRELWSTGQSMDADTMLEEVTGAPVEMEAVADLIGQTLRR